jgi:molybdopterin/thiamine biosynthesis adenylyltransferase
MMTDSGRSLTYIGAGGNIGSHAVVSLVRCGCLDRLTIVDPDVYEPRNLASQAIARRDLGHRKVDVLAARIRRIDPLLRVEAIAERVERVPLGRLRAHVIATGLDGLASRAWVNRAARRLGVPWVDAGVRAEGLLARVDVFEPTADAACLECAWSAQERATLDTRYPCDPPAAPAPSGAPAYLGALAASLQCAECVKLLSGETRHALFGRQLLLEAIAHQHYVSTRQRSSACAFDHRPWSIRSLARAPGAITLGQALRLVPSPQGEGSRMRVYGDAFVRRLECPACHASREVLGLASRIDAGSRVCTRCRAAMAAPGIDIGDTLALDHLSARQRRASLYTLGLREGDVFSVENAAGETHFEIGGR